MKFNDFFFIIAILHWNCDDQRRGTQGGEARKERHKDSMECSDMK